MRGISFILMLAIAAAALAQTTRPVTAPTTAPNRNAVVVVLSGDIDEISRAGLERRINEARALGAGAVILRIDTYGGLVKSALEMSTFIKKQKDLPIIAFIDDKAYSAGAMISLACNEIVMAEDATIGDCAPIAIDDSGRLQPLPPAERGKAESPVLADFRDSAQRRGYDPLLAVSMVSVERTVHYIEDAKKNRRFVEDKEYNDLITKGWKPVEGVPDPLDDAKTLLTVHTPIALKIGLAKASVASAEELARSRNLNIIATLTQSFGERAFGWLDNPVIRGLLVTLFALSVYAAFHAPGHGMAEVLVIVSLSLLVGVPLMSGYAQWWEILVILVGIALLALEVFVIPGFGVTGISGIVLILFGLVMTFSGQEPTPGILPTMAGTWNGIRNGLLAVLSGLFGAAIIAYWLRKYLPDMPVFNRLVLTATTAAPLPGTPAAAPNFPIAGSTGKAMTDLRPGGTAEFVDPVRRDRKICAVISDSGFVPAGADLVVREASGNRIIVRPV